MTGRTASVPFVDLEAAQAELKAELSDVMAELLDTTDWVLGSEVTRFEDEFAVYCGVPFGVGVDSGTSALELSLRAFNIGPGDEVIAPANSFIATAFAVSYTGATPVLVDVAADTGLLDPDAVEAAIGPRTRAVIPVHLFGCPAPIEEIRRVVSGRDIAIIEDACQAHGARYRGDPVGSLGDAAAFSFYPAKNLGALGDGGMITTRRSAVANGLRMLRNYGQRTKHLHECVGYNRRLDNLQAAVLRVKLRRLDDWNAARTRIALLYAAHLAETGVVLPTIPEGVTPVWHLFVVRTEHRDDLATFLAGQGIATQVHYPVPIHLQPSYSDLRHAAGSFPSAELRASTMLSLPMYPQMDEDAVASVASSIRLFADGKARIPRFPRRNRPATEPPATEAPARVS